MAEHAWAITRPRGDWERVDTDDVSHTAALMHEADWRARFEPHFGPLEVPDLEARDIAILAWSSIRHRTYPANATFDTSR